MADTSSTSYSVAGGSPSSTEEDGQLPKSSRILLIATTSIAGGILLLFLVYVIHRMRKGAALADILKLRRHDPSPYMVQRHRYPIHYEQRYSVRSSRYPLSFKNKSSGKTLPILPGPVTHSGASMADYKPPSMIMEPHMAYLKGSDKKLANHPSTKNSRASAVPTISVQSMGDEPNSPPLSTHRHSRWSWTNSEAPSTPRLNIERKRTSSGSLVPNYKPVGFGNDYHMDAIQEDSIPTPGLPTGKAQEILQTGGIGYLPPKVPPKPKLSTWRSVFRREG